MDCRLIFDVVYVIEVTKHVKEETSVERKQEVYNLGVVAFAEHDAEIVVEDDAELDLEGEKIID